MAFDAATGKLVLFGGFATGNGISTHPLGDTWTLDGSRWIRLQPSPTPIARTDPALAYDAVRRVVVLRGGVDQQGAFINDTWTWDGTRWIQMSPGQSPPLEPWNGSQPMCWDSEHGVVVLFDDTGRYRNPIAGNGVPELDQTWAWDGRTWTRLAAPGAPSGHGSSPASIAFDAAHKSTVFFGHVNGAPTTWTFDGTAWQQVSTSGSASDNFSMVGDDARSDVVLFGENGDTWTWDGVRWAAQNPAHSPGPRIGASMAYDSVRHVVVLFGGVAPIGTGVDLNDMWTWNGSDWAQAAPTTVS